MPRDEFTAKKDAALVERCLTGDAAAWEELVWRLNPIIRLTAGRTLARRNGRHPVATGTVIDDLAQCVYLRLLKNNYHVLRGYELSEGTLDAWAAGVARYTTLEWLRSPENRPVPRGNDVQSADESSRRKLEYRDRLEYVQSSLTREEWEAFDLLVVQGLPVSEVSQALGISARAVYCRKSRIMNKLRNFVDWRP
jgi:RNA polymerase sigma-70 factor (ECF subfamily)